MRIVRIDRTKNLVQAAKNFLRMYRRSFSNKTPVTPAWADRCEDALVKALRPFTKI